MMKKRVSLLAFALVLFASIGFVVSNTVTTEETKSNEELAFYSFDKDFDGKCGAGKCGSDDGKE